MTDCGARAAILPVLSVVIPVFDEQDNVLPLLDEIVASLRGKMAFEVVFVDDASTDDTTRNLRLAMDSVPELRLLQHRRRSGQSTAIRSGVKAARGGWIATLDGDGQNDPADLPRLWSLRESLEPGIKLIAGWRVSRRDPAARRWSSRLANGLRERLLNDHTPDTGCGIRLFEREAFLDLPYFDHMHRYLPALMQRAGWRTLSVPVMHRPRTHGRSKYTNLQRALVGVRDLLGVGWLIARSRIADVDEVQLP